MAAEEKKKVVPDPPCCRIPWCRENVNDSCLCAGVGRLGFDMMDDHRRGIFLVLTFFAIIATVLSVIPLVSMSSDKDTVKDTYWTYGEFSDKSEIYISIKTVVLEANGANGTSINDKYNWDSDSCDDFGDDSSYCDDCEEACILVRRTVIANLATIWLTISTNYKRTDKASDLNFTKCMAIFSGTVSSIVMISALSIYSDQCYSKLPDKTADGLSIDYSYGPGFICLLFPQVFKLIEVVFNIATPVPKQMKPILAGLHEPLSPDDVYADF